MYTLTQNANQIRKDSDGVVFYCSDNLIYYEEYKKWISSGGVPSPMSAEDQAIVAKAAQTRADIIEARVYAKLTALSGMTPLQVRNWVTANVTTLAQAQDAIATLAIAVGILWRDKQ